MPLNTGTGRALTKNKMGLNAMMSHFDITSGNVPADVAGCCVVCETLLPQNINVRVRLSGSAHLRACPTCGTWVYFPRQTSAAQAAIHDDEAYFEHPYFKLRRTVNPAQRRRCKDIFFRLGTGIDTTSLRGQRVLDIGCDTGVLLQIAAEEYGVVPVGIDVASRAVSMATQHGIEVYRTNVEQAPEHLRDFAVITAIDLLEHTTDPVAFLVEIRKRLRPGGIAYLETPNIQSAVYGTGRILSSVTGGKPRALVDRLFPEQHIQYFNRASLVHLARKSGLEVVQLDTRILPGADIAASIPVNVAVGALQLLDRLTNNRILLWAVLRRPA
jgi:2-polyprenyl-3-methyl-5-hydroxy-6-metoxy-1,4-benzoquinol methylase